MSAFDDIAAADVALLTTDGETVPRRILAEAVQIGESALAEARYLRGESPGEFWWEPWCEDHPGDHPGDPDCRACLGASHDAWMHRAKAAEGATRELVAMLAEAVEEVELTGCREWAEARALLEKYGEKSA